jgi:hypothetical protein
MGISVLIEVLDVEEVVEGATALPTLQTLWYQLVMDARPLGLSGQAVGQTTPVVVEKAASRESKQKHDVYALGLLVGTAGGTHAPLAS